jgi:hypothetical protein
VKRSLWPCGNDFETLKRTHATDLDQNEFIGAFHEEWKNRFTNTFIRKWYLR